MTALTSAIMVLGRILRIVLVAVFLLACNTFLDTGWGPIESFLVACFIFAVFNWEKAGPPGGTGGR